MLFGVFGLWVNGMITHLWPKLYGREWFSAGLNSLAYWLTTLGMAVMFLDLVAAGLLQGFLWQNLAPWEDSLVYSVPFWFVRTVAGAVIIVGQVCLFLNMWWTARSASSEEARLGMAAA
jgi:cbb3-type cytochrome oxidase subunit 1